MAGFGAIQLLTILCLTFGPSHGQLHGEGTHVTCRSSFYDVTEALWRNDVNRLDHSAYTLNFQSQVSPANVDDHSAAPFFSRVDTSILSTAPTYRTFLALLNNYDPTNGHTDLPTTSETAQVANFLDEVMSTSVMETIFVYLRCHDIVTSQADLRAQLKALWFTPYSRHSGGPVESSGFEHVMVGEFKSSTTVNGLHNWLSYYTKERDHEINYFGYVDKASPDLVALNYDWDGRIKGLGSFFVGTSPEFDMALYTLCALTRQEDVRLDGRTVNITIYDLGHISGFQLASAYPRF